MMRQPFNEIALRFVSGQDPGWFLSIDDKDKIELFDTIRMIEVVIRRQGSRWGRRGKEK